MEQFITKSLDSTLECVEVQINETQILLFSRPTFYRLRKFISGFFSMHIPKVFHIGLCIQHLFTAFFLKFPLFLTTSHVIDTFLKICSFVHYILMRHYDAAQLQST